MNTPHIIHLEFPTCTTIQSHEHRNNQYVEELCVTTRQHMPYAFIIQMYAFLNCGSLHTITIDCKHHIGHFAFKNCTRLKHVNFKHTTFGTGAFSNCTSLEYVQTDACVISEECFHDCKCIQIVDAPNLHTVGRKAFRFCKSLKTLHLPALCTIHEEGFAYCKSLEEFRSSTIQSIGTCAFINCKGLNLIEINNNTTLQYGAFAQASALETIILSSHVTIKKVRIPGLHDPCIFQNCNNIKHMHLIGTTWVDFNFTAFNNPLKITIGNDGLNSTIPPTPHIWMHPNVWMYSSKHLYRYYTKPCLCGDKEIVAIIGAKKLSTYIIKYIEEFIVHHELLELMRHISNLYYGYGKT